MMTLQTALANLGIANLTAPGCATLAVVGLLLLLQGYRLVRLVAFLAGALAGFVLACLVVDSPVALGIGVLVGLIALILADLGVFLVGAGLGCLLAFLMGIAHPLVLFLAGIGVGLLVLAFKKLMIVVATSCTGAYILVGVGVIASKTTDLGLVLPASIVLSLIGIACQYSAGRGDRKTAEPALEAVEGETAPTN